PFGAVVAPGGAFDQLRARTEPPLLTVLAEQLGVEDGGAGRRLRARRRDGAGGVDRDRQAGVAGRARLLRPLGFGAGRAAQAGAAAGCGGEAASAPADGVGKEKGENIFIARSNRARFWRICSS